jgi:NAD(P)-dependent dehydrogenase (short-subunit alcohol dehydrogenase family)
MAATKQRELQDKRALVTGATTGIGQAIALELGREGAEVIVHGRDAARGAETVDAIEAEGGYARFVGADLSDLADVRRLIGLAGDLDILVNNAGFGPTADLDVDDFLVATIGPRMAARGNGSIINVGSAGEIGLSGGVAYGATKADLSSMTRAWAAEFSTSGVRVNAIAPGPVTTEEIAEVVGFLASPRASDVTGTVVVADLGRLAS